MQLRNDSDIAGKRQRVYRQRGPAPFDVNWDFSGGLQEVILNIGNREYHYCNTRDRNPFEPGAQNRPGLAQVNSVWTQKLEVILFDPQKILQQVLGGGSNPEPQNSGQNSGKRGISTDTLKGAALGGLAGLLLGSKQGRKLGGSAIQMGGIAILGGLAFKAWQNWQAQKAGQTVASSEGNQGHMKSALETRFLPKQVAERNELSLTLLSAMISAAKSDGHIDATEQERIFARIDEGNLSGEEKGFLMDQIRKPLDIDEIAAKASTPELAAEIYAASLLAIDPNDPKETAYLNTLANRLKLDSGLRSSIETEIRAATVSVP